MNYQGRIITVLAEFLRLFADTCDETDILEDLLRFASGPKAMWTQGRRCFEEARSRIRRARREKDALRMIQCDFEEMCAKTLYNLSGGTAPYDCDSPFWIVPNALALAKALGIGEESIIVILDSQQPDREPTEEST